MWPIFANAYNADNRNWLTKLSETEMNVIAQPHLAGYFFISSLFDDFDSTTPPTKGYSIFSLLPLDIHLHNFVRGVEGQCY